MITIIIKNIVAGPEIRLWRAPSRILIRISDIGIYSNNEKSTVIHTLIPLDISGTYIYIIVVTK